ncbi:MAG: hypothetical protein ACOC6H_03500 [Thermoproteota archaeon]
MGLASFSDHNLFLVWSITFYGATVAILVGAFLVSEFYSRMRFLFFWTVVGVIASILPVFITAETLNGVLSISVLLNLPLVFGLPGCLAEFVDHTEVEKRTRLGGLILLMIMGISALTTALITENIQTSLSILIIWRGLGLIAFLFKTPALLKKEQKRTSFLSIVIDRSFLLYLIPWIMFSLVNFLSTPIVAEIQSEDFLYLSRIIGNVLAGIFAVVGGFLSDTIGRKKVAIVGFIMIGVGYAVLGIYPLNLFCWYFYTIMDGVAWGMLYVIFVTTIWGDLAYGKPSEKHYALGSLPYLLSSFLRFTEIGAIIEKTVSPFAIFSFTSFFLFLAVLPLMFAPETLPEKKIKERELKKYIDKAKEVKEKYN